MSVINQVDISARAFNRQTGAPVSAARTERIDGLTNELFRDCTTIMQYKEVYESFWNDLNPESAEVVFVLSVTPIG